MQRSLGYYAAGASIQQQLSNPRSDVSCICLKCIQPAYTFLASRRMSDGVVLLTAALVLWIMHHRLCPLANTVECYAILTSMWAGDKI